MSTIPEIVTAHHCDMKTLCLSLVTNKVVMEGDEGAAVANHAEVLEAGLKRSAQMQMLVKQIVLEMNEEYIPNLPPLKPVSHLVPFKAQKTFEESFDDINQYGYRNTKPVLTLSNFLVASALVSVGAIVGVLTSKKIR